MIGRLMITLLPVQSLLCNGAGGHGESVHKAQTVIISALYLMGDGGGRGGRGLSVHGRRSALLMIAPDCVFLSDRSALKVPPADSTGAVSVG